MNSPFKLKSSLTCSYCSKISKCPIELLCDDLICQEHLKEKEIVQINKIKCLTCKREFEVKDHEFNLNESIQEIINTKVYLSGVELTLKTKIQDAIKDFYAIYEEFILFRNLHGNDWKNERIFEFSYLKKLDEIQIIRVFKSVEDDLKDLEKTFRNPNLLIESIKEMQQKQEETVQAIQLKLNEMIKINDDLKASNEFMPFLFFNKDMLGRISFDDQFKMDLDQMIFIQNVMVTQKH